MRLNVILFVLTSSSAIVCNVIAAKGAPKNVSDFVDVLRRDLRRNNDDYIELTTTTVGAPSPKQLATTKPTNQSSNDTKSNKTLTKEGSFYYRRGPSDKNKLFIDIKNNTAAHRRLFASLESIEVKTLMNMSVPTPTPIRLNVVPRNATTKVTRTLPTITTLKIFPKLKFNRTALKAFARFRNFNKTADIKETNKIDKIKNFIKKNRQLFDDFMHKKKAESQKDTESLRINLSKETESGIDVSNIKDEGLRQRAYSAEVTSLRPDQLDMAPARGAAIHAWRVKGVLCQRSVLIPEGPKYNSRGEKYLDEYGHYRGLNFSRTRSPKYLLPRCCNCCKKSLLGCE